MGRHRLPKYVQAWVNRRHGSVWHYFRRSGFERVRLPGLPYSKEFMDAYVQAMAGQAPCPIVERPARPGTINALAISYLSSTAFGSLAKSTQAPYRNFVAQFCKEHGDYRVDTLQREHIVRMMDRRSTTGAKNRLRKVLRAMMQHAVAVGMRSDDPTRDVKAVAGKAGGGHHPWTEEEIAQFENCHPIGSRARLAQALLLYTGQRRGDIIRMGRQHVRDGMLQVKQEKTGAQLSIPVHPDLQEIIDASVTGLTFLTTKWGKGWHPAAFTNWFGKQCKVAGLRKCSAHGLRHAAARRLAEAGCTAHEIAAITGHASLREVQRYTKAADQKRLAAAAMQKMRTEQHSELSNHGPGLTKRANSRD